MALHVVGVRHHSPACARLVDQTIRRLAPRFVLIEGPCDMNDRLGELVLPHELPVALFSYRQDAAGTQRATWSPFCDYSPEWVALSAARDVGATALFVDLPSWDPAFDGEENRYSDRHARASDRLAELCVRLGFEDTDAVWDHLFEQPEDEASRQARLSRYFEALRGDEPGGPRDGPREDFMCRYVKWAISEAGDRDVVLVCGGYHKPAIERAWASADGGRPEPPAPGPDVRVGSYLVPFSFRRLDSFSGYASGMPSPGFYQALWDQGHDRAPEAMLFAAVRHLRAQRLRVSPADAIAASTLAHGLRALRGHDVLTRIDVLDGLAGALVKDALESPLPWTRRGTLSPRTEPLLVEIVAAFSGSKIGKLAPGTPRPPLVDDAFAELERARIAVTREKQRVVAVLTTPAGVLQSSVLHRLRVLGIPGFVQTRAPSLARGKTELSEEWSVHHLLETDPALIEASAYGATLEGAAAARLEERSRDATDVAVVADALVDAALCGIRSLTQRGLADVARLVATEPSFGSLGVALAKLLALRRGDLVLGERGKTELGAVIAACFDRGLWLFEGIQGPSAPLDEALVSAVRALRDVLRVGKEGRPALDVDAERARAVCERRTHDPGTPPALRGAALGLLWSLRDASVDAEPGEDDASRTVAVLRAVARPETFGDLLAGLFALAREQVIRAPGLLAMVDATVTGFLPQDFLVALPGLRQAFSYFPPRERLSIAEAVLALGQDEAPGVLHDPRTLLDARVDVAAVQRGAAIERAALALATRFGLRDALDGGDA